MVVADLHVHTTNSDGSLTLADIPEAASDAGVETVAVTDHDRLHPQLDGPRTDHSGIELIHGIELRVETPIQRIDLLGYGARRTDGLSALVDSLQQDRIDRAARIVDCVETELGVELDVALEPGVGRPHIARAIDRSDAQYDYRGAFRDLIGNDCDCYVARDIPAFDEGRRILSEACSVVGLAHPLRYGDPEAALARAGDLDSVELYYPYDYEANTDLVRDAADRHNLLVTGGSDAHDTRLGRAGLDREGYERFSDQL